MFFDIHPLSNSLLMVAEMYTHDRVLHEGPVADVLLGIGWGNVVHARKCFLAIALLGPAR